MGFNHILRMVLWNLKYYDEDVIVYIPIIWVAVSNILFHPYLGK